MGTVHGCLNWASMCVLAIKLPHQRKLESEIATSMDRGAQSLLSNQSRFCIHTSLIFLLSILQNWDLISVRSGFGDPILFTPEISHPTITYLCLLRDPSHGKKSILKFIAVEEKKPQTQQNQMENRGILFPIISVFQKGENVPLGVFRQLHP